MDKADNKYSDDYISPSDVAYEKDKGSERNSGIYERFLKKTKYSSGDEQATANLNDLELINALQPLYKLSPPIESIAENETLLFVDSQKAYDIEKSFQSSSSARIAEVTPELDINDDADQLSIEQQVSSSDKKLNPKLIIVGIASVITLILAALILVKNNGANQDFDSPIAQIAPVTKPEQPITIDPIPTTPDIVTNETVVIDTANTDINSDAVVTKEVVAEAPLEVAEDVAKDDNLSISYEDFQNESQGVVYRE